MDLEKISELIAQYKDGTLNKSDIKQILLQQQSKTLPMSEAQKAFGLYRNRVSNLRHTIFLCVFGSIIWIYCASRRHVIS